MSRGYGWAVLWWHASQHVTQPWIWSQCWQHGEVGSIPGDIVDIVATRAHMLPTIPTMLFRISQSSCSQIYLLQWFLHKWECSNWGGVHIALHQKRGRKHQEFKGYLVVSGIDYSLWVIVQYHSNSYEIFTDYIYTCISFSSYHKSMYHKK